MKARVLQFVLLMCSLVPAIAWGKRSPSYPHSRAIPDLGRRIIRTTPAAWGRATLWITPMRYRDSRQDNRQGPETHDQTEFWKNARPGFTLPTLNDPRMTYDPLAERWYILVQAQSGPSYGFLAVSESVDPTRGWKGVQLPMKPANLGMKLGFDKNGVYITFIIMTGDTHTMHGYFCDSKG